MKEVAKDRRKSNAKNALERAGRRYRELQLRQRLYERVIELRKEGHSYREIQEFILEKLGEKLSKSIISVWARGIHTPYGDGVGRENSKDQRLNKIKLWTHRHYLALSYLTGMELGDGTVVLESKYHYAAKLSVKDYDFAKKREAS